MGLCFVLFGKGFVSPGNTHPPPCGILILTFDMIWPFSYGPQLCETLAQKTWKTSKWVQHISRFFSPAGLPGLLYTHTPPCMSEFNSRPREAPLKSAPVLGTEGVRCEHDRWDKYEWKSCSVHGLALNIFSFEVKKFRKYLFHVVLFICNQINE